MNKLQGFATAVVGIAFANAYGAAELVNNGWQAAGGDYSGCVTNVSHWGLGHAPTALERMYIWGKDVDYTVSFPEGAYTNAANFWLAAANGRAVTVDGSNSTWVMPGSDDATELYDANAIRIQATDGVPLFSFDPSKAGEGYATHAIAEFGNFKFSVTGSSVDPKMTFDGGTYNFREPAGSTWASAKKPMLLICGGSGEATGTYDMTFKNGVNLRAWDVALQAGARQGSKCLFDGGNYYFEDFQAPNTTVPYAWAYDNVSDITLTNGVTLSASSVAIGNRKGKTVNLRLNGEGTVLESRGAFSAAKEGVVDLDVRDGAELRLGGDATIIDGQGKFTARFIDAKLSGAGWTMGKVGGSGTATLSCADVGVTNSTVNLTGTLTLYDISRVTTSESVWQLGQLTLSGNVNYSKRPSLTVDSGAVTSLGDIAIGAASDLVIKGGTFTAARYVNMNGAGGTLTVAGGVFDNDFTATTSPSPSPVNSVIYVGKSSGSANGALNVTGGEAKFNSIYTGWNESKGEINVSGGKLSIRADLRLGAGAPAGYEHTLTQTGGEIYAPINLASIGYAAGASARVRLLGGKLTCKSLQAGTARTAGNVVLEANGGTLAAYEDSANFIRYFNVAEIGANGLTIDTDGHAITLDQNFTGTGTLTLTGGGTVTFSAGMTVEDPVKVVGDTKVVFNGFAPNGLTLGDATSAAKLDIVAGSPVAVNGGLALNAVSLAMSGLSAGVTSDVFTVSGTLSGAAAENWADVAISGVPSSAAYEADIVETAGVKHLRVIVREPKTVTVTTPAGASETHTTNITWAVNDTGLFDVGAGGEARMEGVLSKGWLVKEGLGTLTLANSANGFFNGIKFRLGALNFDLGEDLLVTSPLWLDAANGADELRFTSGKSVRFSELHTVKGNGGTGSVVVATAGQVAFDIPTTAYAPIDGSLTVEEGEARFTGPAEGGMASTAFGEGMRIGVHGKGGSRSTKAGLVVDNANFSAAIGMATGMTVDDPVEEVYLVLTNGSKIATSGTLLKDLANRSLRATITLDSSEISGGWEYNNYAMTDVPLTVFARNGSKISGSVSFRGNCDFNFDASELAKDVVYYANWQYTNNFAFVNGSVCNVPNFRSGWAGGKYANPADIRLTFDDSEMKGMANGDFGPHDPGISANPKVTVFAKSVGLKMNVPAEATYTWSYPLKDAAGAKGGFVKQGEGTLRVCKVRNPDMTVADAFSFAQTGRTVVEAGTLDLDGNTWTNATIAGAGTVANGTLANAKIVIVGEAAPTFAADCAFDGNKAIVDLAGADLPVGTKVTVAKYEGSAPDVSKWRLVNNNGRTKGTFEAKDGEVVATIVKRTGLLVVAW